MPGVQHADGGSLARRKPARQVVGPAAVHVGRRTRAVRDRVAKGHDRARFRRRATSTRDSRNHAPPASRSTVNSRPPE